MKNLVGFFFLVISINVLNAQSKPNVFEFKNGIPLFISIAEDSIASDINKLDSVQYKALVEVILNGFTQNYAKEKTQYKKLWLPKQKNGKIDYLTGKSNFNKDKFYSINAYINEFSEIQYDIATFELLQKKDSLSISVYQLAFTSLRFVDEFANRLKSLYLNRPLPIGFISNPLTCYFWTPETFINYSQYVTEMAAIKKSNKEGEEAYKASLGNQPDRNRYVNETIRKLEIARDYFQAFAPDTKFEPGQSYADNEGRLFHVPIAPPSTVARFVPKELPKRPGLESDIQIIYIK